MSTGWGAKEKEKAICIGTIIIDSTTSALMNLQEENGELEYMMYGPSILFLALVTLLPASPTTPTQAE